MKASREGQRLNKDVYICTYIDVYIGVYICTYIDVYIGIYIDR